MLIGAAPKAGSVSPTDLITPPFSKPCLSVGGKVGFGLTLFDFYVGYHYIVSGSDQYYSRYDSVNDVYYYDDLRAPGHYLSFGIMMYLGSK